jgi:hypothetical protein
MKKPRSGDKALEVKLDYFSKNFLFHNFYLTWSVAVSLLCLIWRRTDATMTKSYEQPTRRTEKEFSSKNKKKKRSKREERKASVEHPLIVLWNRLVVFGETRRGFVTLLLLFLSAMVVWLYKLTEWYDYYFLILFPVMGLLLAYTVAEALMSVVTAVRDRQWLMLVRCLAICALVAVGYAVVKQSQYETFFAGKQPKPQKYVWYDAPGLGPINKWYRAVFWRDERDPYREYPGQMFYLWHEMRHLEFLDDAAAYIRENSSPEEKLFGESGTAPLVAFWSDRDLVSYMADTNTKRLSTRQLSPEELMARIDVPELRYVIASRFGRSDYKFINGIREVNAWLKANFKTVKRFTSETNSGKAWFILERKTTDQPSS